MELWNGKSIVKPGPDVTLKMTSDASKTGWGATCNGQRTQGLWSATEQQLHINVLEMKAAMFAIQAFTKTMEKTHVHIQVDNMTTVANINKMGNTTSEQLIQVTKEMWNYCLQRKITLTAEYLPGVLNKQADYQSRTYVDGSNWKLDPEIFKQLMRVWGKLEVDLFADRTNAQLEIYASWKPDPLAVATDAFTLDWKGKKIYLFPPFCMIGRSLSKIQRDKAEAVIITPVWCTQPWYAKLMQMSIELPIMLPLGKGTLTNPRGEDHPLVEQQRLSLAAWKISGDNGKQMDFQKKLLPSWNNLDGQGRNPLMIAPGENGLAGVWKGKWIPFMPLWQIS
jgi:hypothetical protein